MTRVRLLVVLLASLLGILAAPGVAQAGTYRYDWPVFTSIAVDALAIDIGALAQVSSASVGQVEQTPAALGTSTTSSATFVATEYGGGASLENLSASDATRIQNAANKIGMAITVVGSRAGGTAGAWSDWDYVITGANSATKGKVRNSLPEGHRGVGEPRNIDIFTGEVNTDLPHITFKPC